MRSIFILGVCLLLHFQAHALLVWLQNGTMLHVKILQYGDKHIVFRRLTNGGQLTIPWEQLHPLSRRSLQRRLGLYIEKSALPQVDGVKIYLKNGGVVGGKVLKRNRTRIVLKNKMGIMPIAMNNIYKIEKAKLSLDVVYRHREIYKVARKNYNLKYGKEHLRFAKFLLSIELFAKAQIHLQQAKALTPEAAKEIQALNQKIAKLQEQRNRQKSLQKLYAYQNAHHYRRAIALLEKMKKTLTDEEYKHMRDKLLAAQKKYLQATVAKKWLQQVNRHISRISHKRKVGLASARNYIFGDMNSKIAEELAGELGLTAQQIKMYFDRRITTRKYRYSYRDGTFIVGLQGKNGQSSIAAEPTPQRAQASGASELLSADEWWQTTSASTRREWLLSLYIENQLQVIKYNFKVCTACGGRGTFIKKGKDVYCPSCHGYRYERIVIAR